MARPQRFHGTNALYHVFVRGNNQQQIVLDDEDRFEWMRIANDVVDRCGWRCLAYCLMTNHFHLLVQTPQANIAEGMQRWNFLHARRFNRRHGRVGHLFERRYASRVVQDELHLLEVARYIDLNPVAAGACSDPERWFWSSYRANAGLAEPRTFHAVQWVWDTFGGSPPEAHAEYRKFVAAGRAMHDFAA
jgi:REP element-mobilizing transposase RayT